MGQQQDRSDDDGQGQPRGRGPGHTVRAGFGPRGEPPSPRPPRTPPQSRPEAPPREDGNRLAPQQYAPGSRYDPRALPAPAADPWAASTGGSWQQAPPGPYPP